MKDNAVEKKFSTKMIDAFESFGNAISQQRQLSIIRDGFGTILPIVITGSLCLLMVNFFLSPDGTIANSILGLEEGDGMYNFFVQLDTYVSPIFNGVVGATMNMITLYLVFFFGYFTFKSYGDDAGAIIGGAIGVAAFFLLLPIEAGVAYSAVLGSGTKYFGAEGVLFGMIMGLSAPLAFYHLSRVDAFNIKLPPSIPPTVGRSLGGLLPFAIVLVSFGAIQPVWSYIAPAIWTDGMMQLGGDMINVTYIMNAFNAIIAKPLENVGDSVWTVFFLYLIISLFWFFGIHGTNTLMPILAIVWIVPLFANMSLVESAGSVNAALETGDLATWNYASSSAWTNVGGTGYVLALVVSLNIFAKDPGQKAMARVSIPTTAFNISEPVVYGLPIMLNLYYAIPFLLVSPIIGTTAYMLTKWGMVNPAVQYMPFTTPPILIAVLTTMDWRAAIYSLFFLAFAIAAYIPFVMFATKAIMKQEAEAEGLTVEEYAAKLKNGSADEAAPEVVAKETKPKVEKAIEEKPKADEAKKE